MDRPRKWMALKRRYRCSTGNHFWRTSRKPFRVGLGAGLVAKAPPVRVAGTGSPAQILVVVANIQMGSLKAEVEKGSTSTAIDRGSVGPKNRRNLALEVFFFFGVALGREGGQTPLELSSTRRSKGNPVNIPEPNRGVRTTLAATRVRTSETSTDVPSRVFFSC